MTRSVIQIRVTEEQKADFLKRAESAGVSLSEYVRAMALSNPSVVFNRPRAEQAQSVDRSHSQPAPLDAEVEKARRLRLKQRKL